MLAKVEEKYLERQQLEPVQRCITNTADPAEDASISTHNTYRDMHSSILRPGSSLDRGLVVRPCGLSGHVHHLALRVERS